MPACGLCMAAYKKAVLVVKTVCLHKSFPKLHPFLSLSVILSHSFFQSPSPSLNLSETQNLSCSLCEDGNPDSCAFLESLSNNSIVFLYKAHAIALTLTLSLTQTDVIKRLFICSQNPACLPTTILWFCQAGFPPISEAAREKLYSNSCFNN